MLVIPRYPGTSTNSGQRFRVQESDPDHRLPKLNYHTMKEKQIRELLSQAELGTTGDKNALMARHQQYGFISSVYGSLLIVFPRWTMLYNANQDRSTNQRQNMEQLRKELKKWEGEGKTKKVDIGDTDEYQVGGWMKLTDWFSSLTPPSDYTRKISLSSSRGRGEAVRTCISLGLPRVQKGVVPLKTPRFLKSWT